MVVVSKLRWQILLATSLWLVFACAMSGQAEESWRFVSIPDFINYDVGSIRALPSYDGGQDSTSVEYEALLAFVLDSVKSERPDFVLVPGDLVMGHWDRDWDNRRIFGQVATDAQKAGAIRTASDHYYKIWKDRFEIRGLMVHAALGDHEIGDNDWFAINPKSRQVGVFKEVFARHFTQNPDGSPRYSERPAGTDTEGTAYAFRHKGVLFVTVDVFLQRNPLVDSGQSSGTVIASVTDGQLRWLKRLLAEANADPNIRHIIVQGHVPVLQPTRAILSSAMSMKDESGETGADTAFWRTLAEGNVDLYLCGEVHDVTAAKAMGVNQIAHGALVGQPMPVNYLVVEAIGEKLDLKLRSIPVQQGSSFLWQTHRNRPYSDCRISPANQAAGFQTTGTLLLDKSDGGAKESNRTGQLAAVASEQERLLVHLSCDVINAYQIPNSGETASLHNGNISGAVSTTQGQLGQGIALGANGLVYAGKTPVQARAPRTISFWVKTKGTQLATVLGFGVNGSGSKWEVDINQNGVIEIGIGAARWAAVGPVVNDGLWHHVMVAFPENGRLGQIRLHIDGSGAFMAQSLTEQPNTSMAGLLVVGSSVNNSTLQKFQGSVDDIGIWGRELSPAECRALYLLGKNLGMNAKDSDGLLAAFREFTGYTDSAGRRWKVHIDGLEGSDGELMNHSGILELPLASGAGMATRPDLADPQVLHVDFESEDSNRLVSRVVPETGLVMPLDSVRTVGRVGRGLLVPASSPVWDISVGRCNWDSGFAASFWFKSTNPSGPTGEFCQFRIGADVLSIGSTVDDGCLRLTMGGVTHITSAPVGNRRWHHLVLSKFPGADNWTDVILSVDGRRWSLAGWKAPWPSGALQGVGLGGNGFGGKWDDIVVSRYPISLGEARLWYQLGKSGLHSAFGATKLSASVALPTVVENRSWRPVQPPPGTGTGNYFPLAIGETAIATSGLSGHAAIVPDVTAPEIIDFSHEPTSLLLSWTSFPGMIYRVLSEEGPTGRVLGRTPPSDGMETVFRLPLSSLGQFGLSSIVVEEDAGPWIPPKPRLISVVPSANSIKMEWQTTLGSTYRIMQSEDLRSWKALPLESISGTGKKSTIHLPDGQNPPSGYKFFRLQELSAVPRDQPPHVLEFEKAGPCVTLAMFGTVGRDYRFLASGDLKAWRFLGSGTVQASNVKSIHTFPLDPMMSPNKGFFKVEDVTKVTAIRTDIQPPRFSIRAKIRNDRTYRLVASDDLVHWGDDLAWDLQSDEGLLTIGMDEPNAVGKSRRFFRLEEE